MQETDWLKRLFPFWLAFEAIRPSFKYVHLCDSSKLYVTLPIKKTSTFVAETSNTKMLTLQVDSSIDNMFKWVAFPEIGATKLTLTRTRCACRYNVLGEMVSFNDPASPICWASSQNQHHPRLCTYARSRVDSGIAAVRDGSALYHNEMVTSLLFGAGHSLICMVPAWSVMLQFSTRLLVLLLGVLPTSAIGHPDTQSEQPHTYHVHQWWNQLPIHEIVCLYLLYATTL